MRTIVRTNNQKRRQKSTAYDRVHPTGRENKMATKSSKLSGLEKKLLLRLGKNIRDTRMTKKLTVYDLTGEDMPIKSRQHWQRIENGEKNINLTTLFKIAKTLKVRAVELIEGID